ncbi:MAG: YncE family protein [Candidatus Acidiferrales bacterium]
MIALIVFLSIPPVPALQGPDKPPLHDTDAPLWKVDLKPIGLAKVTISIWPSGFDFADADTLVVAWLLPEQTQAPLNLSPNVAVPAKLNVALLDAQTGKLRSKYELTVPSRPVQVYVTARGNLLISSGESLRLLSLAFKELKEVHFAKPPAGGTHFKISPGGRRLFVCPSTADGLQAQLLDADTLQVVDAFPANFSPISYYPGDRFTLAYDNKPPNFFIRDAGESWQLFPAHTSAKQPQNPVHTSYSFLNETTLITQSLSSSCCFSVLTPEGKMLFTESLPKGHMWGSVTTSRDGHYFAIEQDRMRGLTIPTLDMYAFGSADQLVIYSLSNQAEVFRVKVQGVSPWYPKPLFQQYALSPDGSLVAMITKGVVTTYRVP